jgi:UDP-N-acetylmuramoyl-tripeptide--D-alanyl-D-alanine ligase
METRSLSQIAAACQGRLLRGAPQLQIRGVCTDSRSVEPGNLFVALRGERLDGHDFLPEAIERGAGALLMAADHPLASSHPSIQVDDTRGALGKIASSYRQEFSLPIIGVGGSNGKTTTKELLAAVLRSRLQTLWSPASFNNDIGLPLTLLRLEKKHQALVIELGTNHPGELANLMLLSRPRYGVLTSIGREHLEFFLDLNGVIEEEGALAEWLPADGALFINGDIPQIDRILKRSSARIIRAGFSPNNDWRAANVQMDRGGLQFTVETGHQDFATEYQVQLLGRHQVINALLAIAVGKELGLSRAEVQHGLTEFVPPDKRLTLRDSNGIFILDDSYNANADSMAAALATLRDLQCDGRRVAVLGDMAELGESARSAHNAAGREAADAGADQLFLIGKMASVTAEAARAGGVKNIEVFGDVSEAADSVRRFLRPGDLVLVKGSRSARLERLTEHLREFFRTH